MAVVKPRKQGPDRGKIIDLQKERLRRGTMALADQNHDMGSTKREINLEKGAIAYTPVIRPQDTVVLKAGRGTFKIVFLRVNERDELEMQLFYNGRKEKGTLKMGETQKIWWGTRMDWRPFVVTIKRLSISCRDGVVAKVDFDFQISKESIWTSNA